MDDQLLKDDREVIEKLNAFLPSSSLSKKVLAHSRTADSGRVLKDLSQIGVGLSVFILSIVSTERVDTFPSGPGQTGL